MKLKIAYDKKLHFLAGLIIAIIGGIVDPLFGMFLSAIAGVSKELYDYVDYGLFDTKDMLTTWAGGILGFAFTLLIRTL